ncbi:MAG: GGDEF domain-containing protein [Rhizobacter sp.]|nr:GGDEF domain-containing protein [Chlorobiales bacterium]
MKLQYKIILILAASILVASLFPAVSLVQLYTFENELKTYLQKNVNDVIIINDLNAGVIRYDSYVNKYVATENIEWLNEASKMKSRVVQRLDELIKSNQTSADDKEMLAELTSIKTLSDEYFTKVDKIAKSTTSNSKQLAALAKEYNAGFVSIFNTTTKLVTLKTDQLARASGEVREKFQFLTRIGIIMGAVFIPLLSLLAVYIYRTTTAPINRITALVKEVRTDDSKTIDNMIENLDGFAKSLMQDDEMARLARTIRNLGLEVKEKTKELNEMVITDEKTKLYNFRHFKGELFSEITRAKRFSEKVSVIMIDVDKFKHYNDTNGHMLGDEVLVKVARLIKEQSREIDTPARFGGEEFAVLLPSTDKEEAAVMAERIRKAIEDASFVNQEKQPSGNLTASLGVATYPFDADDSENLLKSADTALYDAKESGRNRVSQFVNLQGLS